jgi:hypothetical protein
MFTTRLRRPTVLPFRARDPGRSELRHRASELLAPLVSDLAHFSSPRRDNLCRFQLRQERFLKSGGFDVAFPYDDGLPKRGDQCSFVSFIACFVCLEFCCPEICSRLWRRRGFAAMAMPKAAMDEYRNAAARKN